MLSLATGDPDSVPMGRYAREALTKLGVWVAVEDRLVRAENVRSALAFVDRGEVPLGIVYETDALIDKQVRVVDVGRGVREDGTRRTGRRSGGGQ